MGTLSLRQNRHELVAIFLATTFVAVGLSTGCPQPYDSQAFSVGAEGQPQKDNQETKHGLPVDVDWVIEISNPVLTQDALFPILRRLDSTGRVLDGVQDRLSQAIGVRPTSKLLWVGSGIDRHAPLYVASRKGPQGAAEQLISVGVDRADRFIDALRGALGENVALGPRLGQAQVLVEGRDAVAVLLLHHRRATVWLAPSDALAAASILQLMSGSDAPEHPLFQPPVDVELERARREVSHPKAKAVALFRGDVRAALKLSGTPISLLVPRPFTAVGAVVAATDDGILEIALSAAFAPEDRRIVHQRLANQEVSTLACGLGDGAAFMATFPVGSGLDQALVPQSPLPSADRLHKGAAIALFPHPNANAAAAAEAANAVLSAGSWAFVGRPKNADAKSKLEQTLLEGGLKKVSATGTDVFVSGTNANAATRLQTAVLPEAFVLALGTSPAFDRALSQHRKSSFAPSCTKKFGAVSLVIDGDRLAEVGQRKSEATSFSRVANSIAATFQRAALGVFVQPHGLVAGATFFLRPPPQ